MTAPRRWPAVGPLAAATALALTVGVALRVAEYAAGRPLWRDEEALLANVAGRPLFEFGVPLRHEQVAPPGFLVVARAWVRVLGDSPWVIRLPPLACGIAALFATRGVARRYLSDAAVPVALALVAVSDDLIYYATEFKQYSTDLLVALGCLGLGPGLAAGAWTRRRALAAGALGVGALWLSHPAVFLLAAIAAVAALDAVVRRDRRRFVAALGLGAAWAVCFAGCFAVSDAMIGPRDREFLWTWWDFAFLPLPPRSAAETARAFWQFANAFTNPVGLASPLGPVGTALLALALFLAGAGALAARGWRAALILLLPIALTVGASALRRYPFHGRVLVFLAPCFVLPVAEGVVAVGRRCGRAVLVALVAFLLLAPVGEALDHVLIQGRARAFDSHGDQRHDLLDYLERR